MPLPRHPRQRAARHHHHPPGAGAGAAAVDRREHLPRQRAGDATASSTGTLVRSGAAQLLRKVGLKEDPDTLITNIGVGKQQLVEIAKALSKEVKLLILDEPTASLSREGQRRAARPAARIQGAGHLLDPDLAQAQRDRQGRRQHHHPARRRDHRDARPSRTSARTASSRRWSAARWRTAIPTRTPKIGETIFEVKNWIVYHPLHADRQVIKGVDLSVRKGEIVGIAGLMGAGRTEFAMSVFGRSYGTQHQRRGLSARQAGRRLDASARRSTTASPTSPRTARPTA